MARVTPDHSKRKKRRQTKAQLREAAEAATKKREQRRAALLFGIKAAGACSIVGGLLVGYNALAGHVRNDIVHHDASASEVLAIKFVDRPDWMDDAIATGVAERLRTALDGVSASQLDPAALDAAVDALGEEPWIKDVIDVRRYGDELVVRCDWHVPAAVVRHDRGGSATYHLVAADDSGEITTAYLLPPTYDFATVERLRSGERSGETVTGGLRIVTGVNTSPPDAAGKTWRGDALAAGLDVARLLHGIEAAADVTVVDVSGIARPTRPNVATSAGGGTSPVVLQTRYGTELYWGRAPRSTDFLIEPSPERKLENLLSATDQFGPSRNYPQWIDLRRDQGVHLK
ncbi:MAG: hypothetical protein AAF561_15040 [Planctomycetota bacterium]